MNITEQIKLNINKIDFELKEVFEKVNIIEKSDRLGHFFEITTESKFLFEDNSFKNAGVRLKIYKPDLTIESVRWFYQIDTLDESSEWIERVSPIELIAIDVNNVILLKQMSESYFSKLSSIETPINESSQSQKSLTIEDKVRQVLEGYNISVNQIEYGDDNPLLENNMFLTKSAEKKIYFLHDTQIKMSDKFMIEAAIKLFEGVNYVSFGDNDVMIDYSPN